MSAPASIFSSSIAKKYWMAISGLFLIVFLLQHFAINFLSVISPDLFNEVSHFMGTNPLVQFALQPLLIFGVLYHLAMGIKLDLQNKAARPSKYAFEKASENASWMSRNMIITGMTIFAFLGLHFYDFWVPEITTKYVAGDMSGLLANGDFRYYEELVHKMSDPIRVGIYCVSFILLSLHLMHGFQSAFQSVGARAGAYKDLIVKAGQIYAIAIPAGFIVIAVFHLLMH
jgi:succinate dehydrogenase / fumarate reductase cytochrome b subunit